MRVFSDLHHGDLYYSFQLLFEKRLGWELLRPIGLDWFNEGFFKIAEPYGNSPDTIKQFLSTETHSWQSGVFLNGDYKLEDGIYHIYDPIRKDYQKAVTLEQFKKMEFDIVISSYQPHDETFARLVKEYQPKAKHIAQMGNIYQTTEVNNVMCSTLPYPIPVGKNVVFYHQEFPLDIFYPGGGEESSFICSFVNLLPRADLYQEYSSKLKEFNFRSFGESCMDGVITGLDQIAEIMRKSKWGWHIKPGGDGFGHIIHNWFACGKPVITNFSDYHDKLAGKLLIDGVTAINLEAGTVEENISRIRELSKPENYIKMCQAVENKFKELVDFDKEEQDIRQFLTRLI